ncbi:helix-turn-helix transcriptional regulator [Actinokineospora auranticolor]|uniref:PadR family transcriptional regulator n=1 Tax=Actinokineospora auranticolor TaxID=155976 RepID=A0A2S6GJC1_9PSEU|nr:helix-turn-helix transcriptional regulator [Actinokineospora auranticolor]PPK65251.1 PadR family transcriptional regulator [Actinokineospora auranticolor]
MARERLGDRDVVALAVLALLAEQPRHPYEMQRLIKERRKDFVTGLPRSLYHAVDRLLRAGNVEQAETTKDEGRPERTTYRITDSGRERLELRLLDLLSTPRTERPVFTAAVSFLAHLPVESALRALQSRVVALRGRIADVDTQIALVRPHLDRLALLELEHARALDNAEADWLDSVVADLRACSLTWPSESDNVTPLTRKVSRSN